MNTSKLRKSLSLETLENRMNPSSYISTGGDLVVIGTSASDSITVHQQSGWFRVVENGVTTWYASSRVWGGDVYVYGRDGNDYVNNYASSLRLQGYGENGNDTLIGDAQNDYLNGGAGNDTLEGYGGNDFLVGGTGYDRLFGMSGNDTLDGGVGDGQADYLSGGSGSDWFREDPYRYLIFFTRNRDNPADFQATAGDRMYR